MRGFRYGASSEPSALVESIFTGTRWLSFSWPFSNGLGLTASTITRLSKHTRQALEFYCLTCSLRIFESIGLGSSAGLFATGIYGVVKVVMTGLALAFMTEQ